MDGRWEILVLFTCCCYVKLVDQIYYKQCWYLCGSSKDSFLLSQLVSALSAQIGDDSWVVRQLCVKGLVEVYNQYICYNQYVCIHCYIVTHLHHVQIVLLEFQIPKEQMPDYTSQVLRVIIALIEDIEEEVAATVVEGLIVVVDMCYETKIYIILLIYSFDMFWQWPSLGTWGCDRRDNCSSSPQSLWTSKNTSGIWRSISVIFCSYCYIKEREIWLPVRLQDSKMFTSNLFSQN